jgi:hypothetical protein
MKKSSLEYKSDDDSIMTEQTEEVKELEPVVLPVKNPIKLVKRRVKKIDVLEGKELKEIIPKSGPKPKKERTQKQKEATQKMLAKLKEKREMIQKIKEETSEIKKQQDDYIREYVKKKLTEKELKKMAKDLAKDDFSVADTIETKELDDLSDVSELTDESDDYESPPPKPPVLRRQKNVIKKTPTTKQQFKQPKQYLPPEEPKFKFTFAD